MIFPCFTFYGLTLGFMSIRLLDPRQGTVLEEVDSTNIWIKDDSHLPGSWVRANYQTQGRGRKGKVWTALGDEKIIFSGKLQFSLTALSLPLISLLAGASLLKAIFQYYPKLESEVKLKWPNDIYLNQLKIAGFLIESQVIGNEFQMIVGLGLNIYGTEIPNDLNNIAGFLLNEYPLEGTAERILFSFIDQFNNSIISVMDPNNVLNEMVWIEKHSYLIHKIIETDVNGKMIRGKVLGYDENGFLLILDQEGMKLTLMDTGSHFAIIGDSNG